MKAFELGVRLFDTADVYGMGQSERHLGRLLKEVPRDQVVVSSKVGYRAGPEGHAYDPHQMSRQIDRSLDNLKTDYLDVYFFHSYDFGPGDQHLDDAVDFMRTLKEDQCIGAIGMRAPHDFALQWAGAGDSKLSRQAERFLHLFDKIRPDVLTVRYSLLSRPNLPEETDIFNFARGRGVGVLIKQALGQGTLLRTHHPRAAQVQRR